MFWNQSPFSKAHNSQSHGLLLLLLLFVYVLEQPRFPTHLFFSPFSQFSAPLLGPSPTNLLFLFVLYARQKKKNDNNNNETKTSTRLYTTGSLRCTYFVTVFFF